MNRRAKNAPQGKGGSNHLPASVPPCSCPDNGGLNPVVKIAMRIHSPYTAKVTCYFADGTNDRPHPRAIGLAIEDARRMAHKFPSAQRIGFDL